MSSENSPSLGGIEQDGKYHCTVDLQLIVKAESTPFSGFWK